MASPPPDATHPHIVALRREFEALGYETRVAAPWTLHVTAAPEHAVAVAFSVVEAGAARRGHFALALVSAAAAAAGVTVSTVLRAPLPDNPWYFDAVLRAFECARDAVRLNVAAAEARPAPRALR